MKRNRFQTGVYLQFQFADLAYLAVVELRYDGHSTAAIMSKN
jgi:hypothetical protein